MKAKSFPYRESNSQPSEYQRTALTTELAASMSILNSYDIYLTVYLEASDVRAGPAAPPGPPMTSQGSEVGGEAGLGGADVA